MPKFTRIAAFLLVAVAFVLAILAFSVGRRGTRPVAGDVPAPHSFGAASEPSSTAVVVAATALPAGVPIVASSLTVSHWAQRPTDGYADIAALTGSVPVIEIPAGSALTSKVLSRGVAMALKPGERALAVPVDEQAGAGNRVLPGDYVDVFVSLKAPVAMSYQPGAHEAALDASQTRLLLSRLRVLAYGGDDLPSISAGQPPVAPPADGSKTKPVDNGDTKSVVASVPSQSVARDMPHTAVLAVPVGEASELLLAVQNGKLSLGVRPPDDQGQPDDALFAAARPALLARTDLSNEQKQQLLAPENRAYAGIDGAGLEGHGATSTVPARSYRLPASTGIQIIRGSTDDSARPSRTNP